MSEPLSVDDVAALLFDERFYDDPLPPKAFHKILYFAEKELEREDVAADIPQFWYMYGTMVALSDSRVTVKDADGDEPDSGGTSKWVECPVGSDDIDADEQTITRARLGVSRALQRYYEEGGLNGLVDQMYAEAPFEVQRKFRRLDQQLNAAADDDRHEPADGCDRAAIRETLHDLVCCFPRDEFPAYEDDLHVWYRLMSAELDSDTYAPTRAKELAQTFWRLFSLELACRENNGLSREDIAEERDLESVAATKDEIRSRLRMYEREKARRNGMDDDVTAEAADALIAAHLDFAL